MNLPPHLARQYDWGDNYTSDPPWLQTTSIVIFNSQEEWKKEKALKDWLSGVEGSNDANPSLCHHPPCSCLPNKARAEIERVLLVRSASSKQRNDYRLHTDSLQDILYCKYGIIDGLAKRFINLSLLGWSFWNSHLKFSQQELSRSKKMVKSSQKATTELSSTVNFRELDVINWS